LQTFITVGRDRAVVNEDVCAFVPPDEAVTFRVIEPLDRAFQTFHERPLRHAFRAVPVACRQLEPIVRRPYGPVKEENTVKPNMSAALGPFADGLAKG
jgi:hypothetical protein